MEFRAFNEYFGSFQVFEDIVFCADEGEVTVVIGPSGLGESTFVYAERREMVDLA